MPRRDKIDVVVQQIADKIAVYSGLTSPVENPNLVSAHANSIAAAEIVDVLEALVAEVKAVRIALERRP